MKNKILAIILSFTLLCSSAILFANAGSIILGDVDGDGKVTPADARLALRAASKLETLESDAFIAADVDFNDKINAIDARAILRHAARLENLPEMPTEENSSDETTTDETTTDETTTEPANVVEDYPEAIKAFFAGEYYLKCAMGENPMELAIDGENYEVAISYEGIDMSLMYKKNVYIKYADADGKKKYVVFDDEMKKQLSTMGAGDFSSVFDELAQQMISVFKFAEVENLGNPTLTENAEYNEEVYDLYSFGNGESKINFYTDGDEVKYITNIDAEGKEAIAIDVVELSADIPSSMISTRKYTKVDNILAFMMDLAALMNIEVEQK